MKRAASAVSKGAEPSKKRSRQSASLGRVPGWATLSEGCEVGYFPRADDAHNCNTLPSLEAILSEGDFRRHPVRIMGRQVMQPRLVCYMSDDLTHSYTYTGLTLHPAAWTPTISAIKAHVERIASCSFNSCLLNYYRNGKDYVSWHADDEKLYGSEPTIASYSLGASRDFLFKHKHPPAASGRSMWGEAVKYTLHAGDVLVMRGQTQQHWHHSIPKRMLVAEPRVSLTFRTIAQVAK